MTVELRERVRPGSDRRLLTVVSDPEDCCRWRQVIALYRERTRSFLASYFSLAALNFRKVGFFFLSLLPRVYKNVTRISLVIVSYFFKAIYLGPIASFP